MDSFEIPSIPKIFVPQTVVNNSENENQTKTSKSSSKILNKENFDQNSDSNQTESEMPSNTDTSPAQQLCANCSQILLSYFMPLQQYVNEVVQIARGDRAVTSRPLISLLNSEVLKSQIGNQSSNKENYTQNNFNKSSQRETYRSDADYKYSQSSISHFSNSESKITRNEYQNQNLNQNPDLSQSQNQSSNQLPNYSQNVIQSSSQTNDSSNTQNNYNQNTNQIETNNSRESLDSFESRETNVSSDNNQRISIQNIGPKNESKDFKSNDRKHVSNKSEENTQNLSEKDTYDSSASVPSPPENSSIEATTQSTNEEQEWNTTGISSPYAFVTIAYNNLSATNAIILANSLLLTNNKSMNFMDNTGARRTIQIPLIILIGGNIDPVLKDAIFMVFDEVISQPMDVRVALLSDQTFGIQQYKLQLWKELQNFEKCLYLESSTLVVGKVTNLFEECQELSACVDWLFPDNFNCSVFVFEPSLTTYEQIISFAIFHQKCSAQKDEGVAETLDEMTLLNQFFGPKWNRISFVYNFVKNDAIYTQIPAFMKYGDSIKIVNFGHMMSQNVGLNNQGGIASIQPWHILFDLLASSQQDVIKSMSIDNFSKFYLNCFIQRLWPILQNHLTPLLVNKYGIGRREGSIFDLIRLLTNESGIETDDHMFTQTPITFRRIKPSAEKISQYDNLSIDDEDDYLSEQMPNLLVDDYSDEQNFNQQMDDKSNEPEKSQPLEQSEPQQTPQQQDERSKREWEAGRIDWMGAHGSDKIINRLKKLIKND